MHEIFGNEFWCSMLTLLDACCSLYFNAIGLWICDAWCLLMLLPWLILISGRFDFCSCLNDEDGYCSFETLNSAQKFPWLCCFVVHVVVAWRTCCLPCYSNFDWWWLFEDEMPCCSSKTLAFPEIYMNCCLFCCMMLHNVHHTNAMLFVWFCLMLFLVITWRWIHVIAAQTLGCMNLKPCPKNMIRLAVVDWIFACCTVTLRNNQSHYFIPCPKTQ